jgi:pyridoxine 5-phosphate synthase
MTKLSVNINKLATLRNARGGANPDVVAWAQDIESYGAEGITIHPRPDERHIRRTDVYALKDVVKTEFNIEGYPSDDFNAMVLEVRPTQVTLVPDPPHVLTSNAGWKVEEHEEDLKKVIGKFRSAGIRTAIFFDPEMNEARFDALARVAPDRIELYTEAFARGFGKDPATAVAPYVEVAARAEQMGIHCNAGHDLDAENLAFFKEAIPSVLERNELVILIEVVEEWYIYPIPFVRLAEPNFNTWLRNFEDSRTNYGVRLNHYNFRGRNERLKFKATFGWNREFNVFYSTPYISKRGKWGLNLQARYREFDEVVLFTQDNERVFYTQDDPQTRQEQFYQAGVSYRPDVFQDHFISLQHTRVSITDSLLAQPGNQLLEGEDRMHVFGLSYRYDYNQLDQRNYPLDGERVSLELARIGLGISDNAPNIFRASVSLSNYRPLGGHWYWHSLLRGHVTAYDELPYHYQEGLGYGNNAVRSYEFYIFDGQYYGLNRNNLKYALIPEWTLRMPRIGRFQPSPVRYGVYANLIADLGYVGDRIYEELNPWNNRWLGGTGLGIDIATNYDFIFRFEYTVNHAGEHGFYIHYRPAI